ncbi:MAG: zinc ribbon domain-containing protein [Gammaproteobacteria bacterium]|nr:zinc ribbon domain-containing protein [Gammaproteobacteria bacterium]
MNRENYYILLELFLDEKSQSVIDASIRKKQGEWSRLRSHPTKGMQAKQYIDLIPDIKKVMQNESLRKAEAAQARILYAKIQKEKFAELDKVLKIISAKGKVLESELKKLLKKFPGIPEQDIRNRISVSIVKDDKTERKNVKVLPKTTAKVIEDNLKIVRNKHSLYDFLALAPTSSLVSLQRATYKKDAEIKKIAQKNAIVTASSVLLGHCQSVFKTDESREEYDATLAQARLVELDKDIDAAGMSGDIHIREYGLLMETAARLGLHKEEARDYIQKYCRKKNWPVQMPADSSADKQQRCGVCGMFHPKDTHNCTACGHPMNVECPQCNTRNPSTARACSRCGFAVGDMANAKPFLEKGKLAFVEKDFSLAEHLLKQAELFWPGHPDIKPLLKNIRTEKQKLEQTVQELHDAISRRLFYQARHTLSRLRQMERSHPDLSLGKTVEQRISAAEMHLQKAKTITREDGLIDAYTAALAEARDCQQALDGMARLPPLPASNLKAAPKQRVISLQWSPSPSKGEILYKLIRKPSVQPNSPGDGETIAKTAQTFWEDAKVEAGEDYYYALYTLRGEAFALQAAIAGPAITVADISGLDKIPGNTRISLLWKTPSRAQSLEVWRKQDSAPRQRGDGVQISGACQDGITDTGLDNGIAYGYLITAVFQDTRGKNHYSAGVSCVATPMEPPRPIEDLQVSRQENHLDIRWSAPKKGAVQLYYSKQTIPFSSGDSIPLTRLAELGTQVPIQHSNSVRLPIDFQGMIYLVPVTVEGDSGIVGTIRNVTSIHDIKGLHGYINYNKLYLEWTWPQDTHKVLVACRHDRYPQNWRDSRATLKICTRQEYNHHSAFVMQQTDKTDYYFSVFVIAGEGEQAKYSAGKQTVVANSACQEIFYEIHLKKNLFGKVKAMELLIRTDRQGVKLPKTVLVKKSGNLPLRRFDGELIYTIAQDTEMFANELKIELSASHADKNCYAKLFLADDREAHRFRLIAPGKNKLALGSIK